ncbi:MAG: hypothetical protein A3F89_02585 [Deltaproteobacteria bacterium RIFCSPLOWO2_12_FULL_50_11]|nr:MAG: hypothetical protein A2053_06650 [Deltaproteobacteria bacterium GWA2_50_8]OGQ65895.1 MAG: hypothetical protein A3F89_02585 [Deltaproteobacteria bacterium RIFCSPLOWO2_12_FULL_50_11]
MIQIDEISQVAMVASSLHCDELTKKLRQHGWYYGYFPISPVGLSLLTCLNEDRPNLFWRRYGTLGDICLNLQVKGLKKRNYETKRVSRAATGPDFKRLFIGGRGKFGKIEKVTLRIHELPQQKMWGGFYWADKKACRAFENKICHINGSLAFLKLYTGLQLPAVLRRKDKTFMMLYFEGMKAVVESHYYSVLKLAQSMGGDCLSRKEIHELAPNLEKLLFSEVSEEGISYVP